MPYPIIIKEWNDKNGYTFEIVKDGQKETHKFIGFEPGNLTSFYTQCIELNPIHNASSLRDDSSGDADARSSNTLDLNSLMDKISKLSEDDDKLYFDAIYKDNNNSYNFAVVFLQPTYDVCVYNISKKDWEQIEKVYNIDNLQTFIEYHFKDFQLTPTQNIRPIPLSGNNANDSNNNLATIASNSLTEPEPPALIKQKIENIINLLKNIQTNQRVEINGKFNNTTCTIYISKLETGQYFYQQIVWGDFSSPPMSNKHNNLGSIKTTLDNVDFEKLSYKVIDNILINRNNSSASVVRDDPTRPPINPSHAMRPLDNLDPTRPRINPSHAMRPLDNLDPTRPRINPSNAMRPFDNPSNAMRPLDNLSASVPGQVSVPSLASDYVRDNIDEFSDNDPRVTLMRMINELNVNDRGLYFQGESNDGINAKNDLGILFDDSNNYILFRIDNNNQKHPQKTGTMKEIKDHIDENYRNIKNVEKVIWR